MKHYSDYCPFCGSTDYEIQTDLDYNGEYWVVCHNCGAQTNIYDSEEKALDAWENRVDLNPASLNYLSDEIVKWAENKNLINANNPPMQSMKIMEELGETMRAYIKKDRDGIIDGIGDTIVTLIIFAAQNGLNLHQCLGAAWDEIKDRTGKTENGNFIKDEE